jgi:CDP-diacylglycerol--glycerol-3-phosphate 3-phosphatidyltransferase
MTEAAVKDVRVMTIIKQQWATWPNLVTVIRGLLCPLLFWLIVSHSKWAAAVFVAVALTDMLDGKLARLLHQETLLGKMLDPVVDKLLVAAVGLGLCIAYPIPSVMILIGIILVREIAVATLVQVFRRRGLILSVTWEGRWKTMMQGIAFLLLLLPLDGDWDQFVLCALVAATTITATSGIDYFKRARAMAKPFPKQ